MTEWLHQRKGLIEGEVVQDGEEWTTIRLSRDHTIRVGSADDDGFRAKGHVLTVRTSFLRMLDTKPTERETPDA
jgi:hypothetical protein